MASKRSSAAPRRHGNPSGGGSGSRGTGGSGSRGRAGGGGRELSAKKQKRKRSYNPVKIIKHPKRYRRRRRRLRRRILAVYPAIQHRWSRNCPPPLSYDCQRLHVTYRWAVACFMPRYYELRSAYGPDFQGIVNDLILAETPHCSLLPESPAEREFQRRVILAVAVLLAHDGFAVQFPPALSGPRPLRADAIRQPWLRALLTGWA